MAHAADYWVGEKVRMSLAVTDASGAAIDPGDIQLKYSVGGAAATTQDYNPGNIVRDSTGNFHYDYDTTGLVISGVQELVEEWINTGTGQSIAVNKSTIEPLPI